MKKEFKELKNLAKDLKKNVPDWLGPKDLEK